MQNVLCEIEEITLEGERGWIPSVKATCSKCGHQTESYGRSESSIKRCLVLLRNECPEGELNFYEEGKDSD